MPVQTLAAESTAAGWPLQPEATSTGQVATAETARPDTPARSRLPVDAEFLAFSCLAGLLGNAEPPL